MSDHAAHNAGTSHPGDDHAPSAGQLRFEKQELVEFTEADRGAGQAIGQLLGGIFCILVVLMVTATIWTANNRATTHDPHAYASQKSAGGH